VPGVKKTLLSWSSGKDSAWALHLLRQQQGLEVCGLVTTFNTSANRVAMHAVRRSLVEAQAESVGLPLWQVELPWPCSNAEYEERMAAVCRRAVSEGITAVAFGDLFLEEIRAYREKQLAGTGLEPLFPVWGIPTGALGREMIRAGQKALITCVDPSKLDESYAGRSYDDGLLDGLPAAVDPCGENGEFHTFVYDGPAFSRGLEVRSGEIVKRDGFVFADVVG